MIEIDWACPPEEEPVVMPDPAGAARPCGSMVLGLDRATVVPDLLSADRLLDGIVGFSRVIAWATARQQELIAAFHARPGDGTVRPITATAEPVGESAVRRQWAIDEIALALTLAPTAAATQVYQADRFAAALQPTWELLKTGRLCPARAKLVADLLTEYDDDIAAAVQARVLPLAPEQTMGQLRAALNKAIIALVPDPEQRHQKAKRTRRVDLYPGRDGMATLSALLTAPEATASFEWITRLARGLCVEDAEQRGRGRGSMDRRRADVLSALLTGRLVAHDTTHAAAATPTTSATVDGIAAASADTASAGTACTGTACTCAASAGTASAGTVSAATGDPAGGEARDPAVSGCGCLLVASPVNAHRPLIHVTVPITTLMGMSDEPGELAGYGPIPAPIARDIAVNPNSVWRRLVTDPLSGQLLDYGREVYRPPAPVDRFVRARDGHCRFKGCRRPAVACEIDHVRPWHPDGTTSEDNLCALCERHHDLKEQPGWQVVLHADRTLTWTTPTGHHYTSRPVDHRVPVPAEPALPTAPETRAPRPLDDPFDLANLPDDEDPAPF